ncbi:MAG: DUF1292 domain-containing protein [Clostridiales bacterium]|nr:DUF1292 domain-containing protein [Clostridiales bacterium]MDY5348492.1 DUF1292 domain-containing protein [Candidatus Ventricola sp.]MDY5513923.1 DUF1292 domain-containing protein [Candidatus Ventricola sp.]
MTNPFENEDEWVEISDSEGNKSSMRHLATIRIGELNYFVLGDAQELEGRVEIRRFLIVREEETESGEKRYVVARDESEIQSVVGSFVIQRILREIAGEEEDVSPCGMRHSPGEFCACGDPDLLQ